ncbi:hypothetical protein TrCOL_g6851 [Triparma columacea]|uniref:J domain-containing protein n=1 Tax=Triparma columacea TaxID=722753 RepID=A0A9W7L761_9STRA|nr:hypothetical protein TrCOL_g6851 [Triparma columacea]
MPPSGTSKTTEDDAFYSYYHLLSIPLPTSASWLTNATPSSPPLDETAIKKLYRKASLKHHPDRGGDPATFIKLKRAAKVLGDEGLRKRYDLVGIDSGLDDCATNVKSEPEAGEAADNEDEGASTQLRQVSNAVLGGLASILLRTLCVYIVLFLVQYKLVDAGATLVVWFLVATKMKDLDNKQRGGLAAAPLLLFLVYYSGPGGWVFWLFETASLALVFLFAIDPPFSKYLLIGLSLGSSSFAWWFKGRFSCYGVVVLIEMILGLVLILIIPFCESLVKETLDNALETYATKMRVAIMKELAKAKTKK